MNEVLTQEMKHLLAEDLKKIEIHSVKVIEYEDKETGKKKKFNAYKAVTKQGKLIDLKFTSNCNDIPTHPCYIYVRTTEYNVATNQKYPCVWVQSIVKVEEFPDKKDTSDTF